MSILHLPTEMTHTGQRTHTDDFGLHFYNARWYDSSLGRFASADSLIPGAGNPAAWDRYAGMLNNPVKFSDPTGHFPFLAVAASALFIVGTTNLVANHALGKAPDFRGIRIANKHMNASSDSIYVAAGIAVQSQWSNPVLDSRGSLLSGKGSGLGIAGVSDAQMVAYGLEGHDQTDPQVAVQAMEARIQRLHDNCTGCSATDLFIVAALGQNGSGFGLDDLRNARKRGYNWAEYFLLRGEPGQMDGLLRQNLSGLQYDTQLMLKLYTLDVHELINQGWVLPSYDEIEWDYVDELISLELTQ